MNEQPLMRLRRLLGEQWSPQWVPNDAIDKACDEIEKLRAQRAEVGALVQCPHCGKALPFEISLSDSPGIETPGYGMNSPRSED